MIDFFSLQRCVPFNLRSYALGFQFVVMKLLGYIPSPVLFGAVVDKSCLLWGESCGVTGACSWYSVGDLSDRLLALSIITTGTSTAAYSFSFLLSRYIYHRILSTSAKAFCFPTLFWNSRNFRHLALPANDVVVA